MFKTEFSGDELLEEILSNDDMKESTSRLLGNEVEDEVEVIVEDEVENKFELEVELEVEYEVKLMMKSILVPI